MLGGRTDCLDRSSDASGTRVSSSTTTIPNSSAAPAAPKTASPPHIQLPPPFYALTSTYDRDQRAQRTTDEPNNNMTRMSSLWQSPDRPLPLNFPSSPLIPGPIPSPLVRYRLLGSFVWGIAAPSATLRDAVVASAQPLSPDLLSMRDSRGRAYAPFTEHICPSADVLAQGEVSEADRA
ncbi:hypothetical protein K523DRAFT_358790 [Schizophyllum commune Tattone D]|nr:hypothetical protein K523DRAFT_358790 [Schizophyllum commune Tattone D]